MIDFMTIEISNLSWFAILAIAIVAVTLIVMQIIRLRGRKAFESLTSTLAAKADDARRLSLLPRRTPCTESV